MSETSARGSVPRGQCPCAPVRPLAAEHGPCSRPRGAQQGDGPRPSPSLPLPSLELQSGDRLGSCLRVFVVLGPMLPAAKDVGQKVVLGALGASVW